MLTISLVTGLTINVKNYSYIITSFYLTNFLFELKGHNIANLRASNI